MSHRREAWCHLVWPATASITDVSGAWRPSPPSSRPFSSRIQNTAAGLRRARLSSSCSCRAGSAVETANASAYRHSGNASAEAARVNGTRPALIAADAKYCSNTGRANRNAPSSPTTRSVSRSARTRGGDANASAGTGVAWPRIATARWPRSRHVSSVISRWLCSTAIDASSESNVDREISVWRPALRRRTRPSVVSGLVSRSSISLFPYGQ